MMDTGTLVVHAEWMASEAFFVWGTRGSGGIWDAFDLKNVLFAWHAPSYYGTTIETLEWHEKKGLLLTPLEALDYFAAPSCARHLPLKWGPLTEELIQISPHILSALEAGQFMPDYEQWKKGTLGWKINLSPDHQPSFEDTSAWLARLVPEWIDQDGSRKSVLKELEQQLSFRQGLSPVTAWMDEEDWLVAIGWKKNRLPFRICLKLNEPAYRDNWKLDIILQDRDNPAIIRTVEENGKPAIEEISLPKEWIDHQIRVQKDTKKWIMMLPWLREDKKPYSLKKQLSTDEAWRFLTEGSLRLVEAGYSIFLPEWWERIRRIKPRMRAKLKGQAGAARESLIGLKQLMEFDWKLVIEDLELTEGEFLRLLEEKRNLVQIRGRWVQIDPGLYEQMEQMVERMKKQKGLTLKDVLELHLLEGEDQVPVSGEADKTKQRLLLEVEVTDHLRQLIDRMTHAASIPDISTPKGFRGTLRPYQSEGISWMHFLRQLQLGGCLADDMGLGKTIQWISYLLKAKEDGGLSSPSLLICPTSVLGNWQMELKRFAPSLNVHLHYGPNRRKGVSFEQAVSGTDLVLTSYTLSHLDEEELSTVYWDSICLDEAQNIKNAYTKQAASIRKLKGHHRIALTGTPIENRLTELWSIFDFLNPGYLGTQREFTQRYVHSIERIQDTKSINQVQKLIRPFLLRRIKKDPAIQLDLPDKNEVKTFVTLSAKQASLYENYIRDMLDRLNQAGGMGRRGIILAALTKLKQICNHPALVLKERPGGPWEQRSGKLDRLVEMVHELRDEGDKCLIFTQFVDTGFLLQHVLEQELGHPVLFLHGGSSKADRDKMIARFQDLTLPEDEQRYVFLLSLKAGGTGLNLTAANHVFHFDRWWNPAVENQATDRAYRIGQTRNVQVHKFITLGTLEERIDEMIEQKLGLSQQIVGQGENWITELDTDELKELLSLRKDW